MAKLYKTYRNASRNASADSVSMDGVDGFMRVTDLIVTEVIVTDSAAWSQFSKRTFSVVKTSSGLFGTTWSDSGVEKYCQTLYSSLEAAMAAHRETLSRYAADPKWQYKDAA
jgi:hypothetical protein